MSSSESSRTDSDLLCVTEDPSCAIDLAEWCSIFVFPSLVACLGWVFLRFWVTGLSGRSRLTAGTERT